MSGSHGFECCSSVFISSAVLLPTCLGSPLINAVLSARSFGVVAVSKLSLASSSLPLSDVSWSIVAGRPVNTVNPPLGRSFSPVRKNLSLVWVISKICDWVGFGLLESLIFRVSLRVVFTNRLPPPGGGHGPFLSFGSQGR